MNVHDNYELAGEFDISRIPRILIFKGGKKPVRQLAGLAGEKELAQLLEEVLAV